MRFCPKCGELYDDQLLAFCLADGTPLGAVSLDSDVWKEGSRAFEQKQTTLKAKQRRLKWQRVVLMTMLMTTLVVTVVAYVGREERPPAPSPAPPKPDPPKPNPEPTDPKPVPTDPNPVPPDRKPERPKPEPAPPKPPEPRPTKPPQPGPTKPPQPGPTKPPQPGPTKLPECSDNERTAEWDRIRIRFGTPWLEGERNKIMAELRTNAVNLGSV